MILDTLMGCLVSRGGVLGDTSMILDTAWRCAASIATLGAGSMTSNPIRSNSIQFVSIQLNSVQLSSVQFNMQCECNSIEL